MLIDSTTYSLQQNSLPSPEYYCELPLTNFAGVSAELVKFGDNHVTRVREITGHEYPTSIYVFDIENDPQCKSVMTVTEMMLNHRDREKFILIPSNITSLGYELLIYQQRDIEKPKDLSMNIILRIMISENSYVKFENDTWNYYLDGKIKTRCTKTLNDYLKESNGICTLNSWISFVQNPVGFIQGVRGVFQRPN